MPHVHLTFELLEAYARGDLEERDLLWLSIRHQRADCASCDVEIQAFEDEEAERRGEPSPVIESPAGPPVEPPAEGLERAAAFSRLLGELLRQAEEDAGRSPAELRRLVTLAEEELAEAAAHAGAESPGAAPGEPGERTLATVRRARRRFRSLPLAASLLDEVRASLPDRPRRALVLARLAETVAWRIPDPDGLLEKVRGHAAGLALAHQGNALRVLDDLRGADRRFATARDVLDHHGIADAEALAEVDSLEGSLRRDQRRFREAEGLLLRAVAHWIAAEDPLGLARALLTLGVLYQQCGRPAEALAHAEAALAALPGDAPARLRLCAEHNRVDYLCDLGHFEVAAELLAGARPRYLGLDDPWTRNRLAWVEGKIAAGLGEPETARERLEAAREGFAAAGALYDTALVSLDLAGLHLAAGRAAEARRLAAETARMFAALEVPREAAAALARLRRAVEEETSEALSAALLRQVAGALRAARPG